MGGVSKGMQPEGWPRILFRLAGNASLSEEAMLQRPKMSTMTVRVNGRESKAFSVRVGVHQGSVLSPLLFIIVLEALSREFREGLPMELLYASDLVLVAETEELLMENLRKWKKGMELKGLRVNIGKTKVSGENRPG